MKLGKTWALGLIIVLFIVLWVPYFQNTSSSGTLMFFGFQTTFVGIYPLLLSLAMIQGFLITFYVKSLISSLGKEEVKKFDL